jgi:hypothetical protein
VTRPRLEAAEVFRSCQDEYFATHSASAQQRRAFRNIVACRTAALGGHVNRCDRCAHEEVSYNSCRDRHCPKCQARRQADWCEARGRDLLDVPYFHLVFTLPNQLAPLALQNQRVLYNLLFRAAAETLLTLARDQKHLGAHIGFLAILHTWGQTLLHHPHLHCLAPGGGLSPDQTRWIPSRKGFLLPVRVLSRLFRHKFLAFLRRANRRQQLFFEGALRDLARPEPWRRFLQSLRQTEWVVYAKPPFGSPRRVLKYLARYTHRTAISNDRLIAFDRGRVAFAYKDYRRGHARRVMILQAPEFVRRFLLHALPKGFVRIRCFGFLANGCRKRKLALCRRLLHMPCPEPRSPQSVDALADAPDRHPCPVCRQGRMIRIETLAPMAGRTEPRMNSPDRK